MFAKLAKMKFFENFIMILLPFITLIGRGSFHCPCVWTDFVSRFVCGVCWLQYMLISSCVMVIDSNDDRSFLLFLEGVGVEAGSVCKCSDGVVDDDMLSGAGMNW